MTTTGKLINISILTCVLRMHKICSLSKFQVNHSVLLILVITLCIRYPEIIPHITESLCTVINICVLPLPLLRL